MMLDGNTVSFMLRSAIKIIGEGPETIPTLRRSLAEAFCLSADELNGLVSWYFSDNVLESDISMNKHLLPVIVTNYDQWVEDPSLDTWMHTIKVRPLPEWTPSTPLERLRNLTESGWNALPEADKRALAAIARGCEGIRYRDAVSAALLQRLQAKLENAHLGD